MRGLRTEFEQTFARARPFALSGLWMYGFIVFLSFAGAVGAKGEEGRLDSESPVFAGSSRPG